MDESIATLYLPQLERAFLAGGISCHMVILPSGEPVKSRRTKEEVEDQLLSRGFRRDSLFIALGGGVILDLVGFIAATFCRGVPFISIPTTLLAMVDAAIGGKVAVNTPLGKNLIGTVYLPHQIYIDSSFLLTQTKEQILSGLVEMLKVALLQDRAFFEEILINVNKIYPPHLAFYERCITRAIDLKLLFVQQDPYDRGEQRRWLNLGHTVGHAIEAATDYLIPHGFAVAIGIVVECYISVRRSLLKKGEFTRVLEAFNRLGIPFRLEGSFNQERFFEALYADKKMARGKLLMPLLRTLGQVHLEDGWVAVEQSEINEALDWMLSAYVN